MPVTWSVGVDFDDDGFICWDARPGDALNVVPTSVLLTAIEARARQSASVTKEWLTTPYGLRVWRVVTGADTFAGVDLGSDNGLDADDIPVTASTQYTVKFWTRGIAGDYDGRPIRLVVRDQNNNLIVADSAIDTWSADWKPIELAFTTGAGDSFVFFTVIKSNFAQEITVEIAGLMVTAGAVAPNGFNAGRASNLRDNLSADVLRMNWRLGLPQAYDSLAAPTEGAVLVENLDKLYSPENAALDLNPGKALRIRSDDATTTRTHLTAFVDRIELEPGTQGKRQAILHLRSPHAELGREQILLAPQVEVGAHSVLAAIAAQANIRRWPGVGIMGIVGRGELDSNMLLAGDAFSANFESGVSTFAYVGDRWTRQISALDAVQQVAASERGRFFFDRDGVAVFQNRHHLLKTVTAQAAFTDNMDGLSYDYGNPADLANHIEIVLTPRSIGAQGTPLWTSDSAHRIAVAAAGPRQMLVRFRDAAKRHIGALSVTAPQAVTDYSANTKADGSGLDATQSLQVVVRETFFNAALLEIINQTGQVLFLQPGAQLRGQPVDIGDEMSVRQIDYHSLNLYGLHTLVLALPALTDLEEADQMARYELGRRSQPRGVVRALQLRAPLHSAQMLARTLFDRITVTDAQTATSGDYFIIAENHTVATDQGAWGHHVEWLLESADANQFCVLDSAKLDSTCALAY